MFCPTELLLLRLQTLFLLLLLQLIHAYSFFFALGFNSILQSCYDFIVLARFLVRFINDHILQLIISLNIIAWLPQFWVIIIILSHHMRSICTPLLLVVVELIFFELCEQFLNDFQLRFVILDEIMVFVLEDFDPLL